jgi:tetratricopeptide (TPR) repeat protein
MTKISILIILFCMLQSTLVQAQSQSELLNEAKELISNLNETAAYPKLFEAVKLNNKNIEALCLASFIAAREGNRQSDKGKRNGLFMQAKIFAESAVAQAPTNAEAHFVLVVALGRIALVSSSKEKVAISKRIKDAAEKCVSIMPTHAGGNHAIGKWHYEVARLNFAEKGAINLLFGGLPTGDINTSLVYFQKAIALKPTYLLYYLDYAKALNYTKRREDAIKQLNVLLTLKPNNQDDPGIIAEAKALLLDWQ